MKRLVRLLLINWYRLDAECIEIAGHTAVIGPNASGKSSLLDAMQTVLVGGDKRQLNLNPSAGEKSTRSLRDYCLGVVRDPDNPDLSVEFRPREQALSYIVLCFRDEDRDEDTAVGLAIHARLEDAQERIDGRFIAPGLSLQLADLTDHTSDGPLPKPWKRLKEELRNRCGHRFQTISTAGEFVRSLCAELGADSRHLDPDRFRRSFRNAITFAPIRNVSDFVRGYILEARPIRVRELQQSLKRYRDIQARTREAKEREGILEALNHQYQRAGQNDRLALAYRWIEQEAAFNALVAEIEPAREELLEKRREAGRLQDKIGELDERRHAADDAWAEAQKRLAASDVALRKARIYADRQLAEQQRQKTQFELDQSRRGLSQVFRLLDLTERLPAGLTDGLETLAFLLRRDNGLLEDLWPESPEAVMAAVQKLAPGMESAQQRFTADFEAAVLSEGRLRDELESLNQRIKRLEQGGSDLSPATMRLQVLLSEHGISAVPLCDRVDVADESWRDAIEGFLGGQREALLVAPDQVRDAIRIYRSEGRHLDIHGSRIVNTLKTDEWQERRTAGSLAEMIAGDDPHALAYVNRLTGNVLRVDSEQDLLKHERAVTADGMLATNGAVLRMHPVEPMLGREARAVRLEGLKQRFHTLSVEYGEMGRRKDEISSLRAQAIDPFARSLETLPDLPSLCVARADCDARLRGLAEEEQALDTAEYVRLEQDVARLGAERKGLERAERETTDAHTRLREAIGREEEALKSREGDLESVAEARHRVEAVPGLDSELAADHQEELESQQLFDTDEADGWRAMGAEAARRAGRQEQECRNRRQKAWETLRDYLARWPAETAPAVPVDADHRPLEAWAVKALDDLRETQLARYAREAESAFREAEHAFRADFVGKLQENLALLDDQLRELNRNLKRRPFHGQYYHFVKKPDPGVAAILGWIETWTPESGGDVGGLFDAANDPNHPHRDAIRRVQTLLMEAGEHEGMDERLADYRYYYHFDVKMSDADGANSELLSRRLGKGSGGEHQSPFYVAIGAALAAAYRLERNQTGTVNGGMALAVFDEAFSKLDVQNTVSALGFLDELGLQVILAAPDEKYGLMSEHVDTIVNVYRDGGTVHIDADYLKPAARELLAADNPVLQGDLADEPAGY